jgi:hypothetical protein
VDVVGGRVKLHLTGSPVFLREDDDMRSVPRTAKPGGKQ